MVLADRLVGTALREAYAETLPRSLAEPRKTKTSKLDLGPSGRWRKSRPSGVYSQSVSEGPPTRPATKMESAPCSRTINGLRDVLAAALGSSATLRMLAE